MDQPSKPCVARSPEDFRRTLENARAAGRGVALVPTMGALHEGHLSLVDAARARVGSRGLVALSIFVNPTQFGPNEDFAKYPRELTRDLALCASRNVDLVFAPEATAMYPAGEETRVHVGGLTESFCGPHRPGHFDGVATIVTKLFALAGPCVALFGRKDYQQYRVLVRLVRDLFLPVEVVGVPTLREADGLAMSSRNRYLSPEDRRRAAAIPTALSLAVRAWKHGERQADVLLSLVSSALASQVDSTDYIDLREAEQLRPYDVSQARAVLALAVRIGTTRLIDNVVLGEDPAPRANA